MVPSLDHTLISMLKGWLKLLILLFSGFPLAIITHSSHRRGNWTSTEA